MLKLYSCSGVLLPLCPATLMHKNPQRRKIIHGIFPVGLKEQSIDLKIFTGAQPKAGTGLKMQTIRFFNVTLLGIYR